MRKEADFEVTDHIIVFMEGNDKLKAIAEKNSEDVKKDVLAEDIVFGSTDGYIKEWNIFKIFRNGKLLWRDHSVINKKREENSYSDS